MLFILKVIAALILLAVVVIGIYILLTKRFRYKIAKILEIFVPVHIAIVLCFITKLLKLSQ